jgi:hypothetical protein
VVVNYDAIDWWANVLSTDVQLADDSKRRPYARLISVTPPANADEF